MPKKRITVTHFMVDDSVVTIECDDIDKAHSIILKARGVSKFTDLPGGYFRTTSTPWVKPLEIPELLPNRIEEEKRDAYMTDEEWGANGPSVCWDGPPSSRQLMKNLMEELGVNPSNYRITDLACGADIDFLTDLRGKIKRPNRDLEPRVEQGLINYLCGRQPT